MSDRMLYSKKEAAQQLSLSLRSLDQLIAQGELRVRRFGKRILVPKTELEKLAKRDVQIVWPESGKATRNPSLRSDAA